MAVAIGIKGNITVRTSAATDETVGEMGSWSISGPTRNMIEVNSFGDSVSRQEIGTLTGQTLTFDGFYDATDTGMAKLIAALSSAVPIMVSSAVKFGGVYPARLKLWAQNDATRSGYGFWALSTGGSTAQVYMTNMELGQSKDGLGTISFTAAVTGDDLKWSTG
jgi:hypothetical protein